MNNKKQYIRKVFGVATMALFMSNLCSCEDFLTITPSNQIVEEDFWEDKTDLQNVVAACYTKYIKMIPNMVKWGELRSDNIIQPSGDNNVEVRNILNANLLPNYKLFDWTDLYNEINCCNKVLAHGEDIVKKDESFTYGAWEPIKAEVITLRALSHFYLLRTWGEVPYITVDYNNSKQNFIVPQLTQEAVLDSIIEDLESVKNIAMKDYGNTVWNKGRITKKSVYTLLADVYLWRASKNASPDSVAIYGNQSVEDYKKCIECCDWVIDAMKQDYVDYINKNGYILGGIKKEDLSINDILIKNVIEDDDKYSLYSGAYDYIFGNGNSIESIFELQIDGVKNTNTINSTYWNAQNETVGSLTSADALVSSTSDSPNELIPSALFTKTDYRRWETLYYSSASQINFPIYKYASRMTSQYNGSTSSTSSVLQDNSNSNLSCVYSSRAQSNNNANFILYRLSDVMLMKAEAISQIAETDSMFRVGFDLCKDLFKRNNPYAYATNNTKAETDSLNFDFFNSKEGLEALVMAERQREFFGEGKRWFDLVRYAQRKGGTYDMLNKYLGKKYTDNKNAIYAKLHKLQSLFSPVFLDEMKKNPLLHQNSVWITNESTSKTDEL
ncbi:MAG: RagB/SusD family nutrient uptake outer membrane protein [Bacteroidaceae bacterium]|nr:RagB/SusD family nutrient uptake outer membrane protein [Bacteroidaceae bacterium]